MIVWDFLQGSSGCPTGWESIDGKCFKLAKEMKTWIEAMSACGDMHSGAQLATPSFDLGKFVNSDIMDAESFWIGLRSTVNVMGYFYWSNGAGRVPKAFWMNVDHQDPDGHLLGPGNDCVAIYGRKFGEAWTVGEWVDLGCNFSTQFLCEIVLG